MKRKTKKEISTDLIYMSEKSKGKKENANKTS